MDILNYKEETLVLDEGVNDPGIFKAIILAGGPGSGKTYVAKKLGLKTLGLRVVNSDQFFQMLLKRKGLSLKMPESEYEAREAARLAAKALTDKRLQMTIAARLGVIVDSTSGDQKKTQKVIKLLKKSGYDIKVIFIQTTLKTAQRRNQERSRTLPERVVEFAWNGAQKVKPVLKRLVTARDYHEIENEFDGKIDTSPAGKFTVWAKTLNQNALDWIAAVKRGSDSVKTEDINSSIMDSFKAYTEALTTQQRMKMGRIAKRTAKKRARKAKIKAKRMKNSKEIQQKAAMMARTKIAKRFTGGKALSQLTIPQKVMIGKKLEKMKPRIAKLTKKLVKVARKAEIARLQKRRASK